MSGTGPEPRRRGGRSPAPVRAETPQAEELATYLRSLVHRSGLTYAQLSGPVGYSTSQLGVYLGGKVPREDFVVRLVRATCPHPRDRVVCRERALALLRAARQPVPVAPGPGDPAALVDVYERLTRALEAQAELERARSRSQQLVLLLLHLVNHLKRQIDELAVPGERTTADGVPAGAALTRAERQHAHARDELSLARVRLDRIERVAARLRTRITGLDRQVRALHGAVPDRAPAHDAEGPAPALPRTIAPDTDGITAGLRRVHAVNQEEDRALDRLERTLAADGPARPRTNLRLRAALVLLAVVVTGGAAVAGYLLAAAGSGSGGDGRGGRASAAAFPVHGTDVSSYSRDNDWEALGAAQQFAMIKATEGTHFVSPALRDQLVGARSAGLITGLYHFFRTDAGGAAQARHFLRQAKAVGYTGTGRGELPPVLDLEAAFATPEPKVPEVLAFLRTVQDATGEPPIVYVRDAYVRDQLHGTTALAPYPRWLPDFDPEGTAPRRDDWLFWQYSAERPVRGGGGGESVFHGSLAELRRRAHFRA
ncbi:GH25 family lysozyme [Streptomyces longispororuber]|uniref:GH25 family lysozyme n=1 Tax=Streptomyces longispororuber TaxID=68230 RepID=UPI00210BBC48|nr:GH25 family lysozyme [Streptomyces longispororuber]MCQ4211194.1 hypothetical protein [Streptomyces longispororuber]